MRHTEGGGGAADLRVGLGRAERPRGRPVGCDQRAADRGRRLPGGKLELSEDPADCVVREISEESGWTVTAGPLLDCWQCHIGEDADVVIVTYGCPVLSAEPPVVSDEHKRAGLFSLAEGG